MPQPLSSNVARPAAPSNARPFPRPHASRYWLPAAVADRLLAQHDTALAGERALAQRERHVACPDGVRQVTDAFRWIYWDVVLIAIERRTSRRFRARSATRVGPMAAVEAA